MFAAINPYWGADFFEFFGVLFSRLGRLIVGRESMVSDELQIAVLAIIGICSTLVGCFLVLRRACMQANALSHTALLGIVVVVIAAMRAGHGLESGISLNLPLLLGASAITAVLTAGLTYFFSKVAALQEDASIGLVFTMLFALSIVIITLYTRNLHIGIEVIMGNVDALHRHDLNLALFALGMNGILTGLLYQRYKLLTFDGGFARVLGMRIGWIEFIMLLQTTLTIMVGFRAVGVILILALITAPVMTALLFVRRFYALILVSGAISVVVSTMAVAFSRHFLSVEKLALSTAGLNIVFLLIFYGACAIFVQLRRSLKRRRQINHPEENLP